MTLRKMIATAANEIPSACRCNACGSLLDAAVAIAVPGGDYCCPGRCTMNRVLLTLTTEPVAESDRRVCRDAILTMRAIRRARRN